MSSRKAAQEHESFVINDSGRRVKVVRQDRRSVEHLECFFEFNHKQLKVSNISPFGFAVFADGTTSIPKTEVNGVLLLGKYEIANPHVKVIRQELDTKGTIGFEVIGEPISMSAIDAIEKCESVINKEREYFNEIAKVPESFRLKVLEVKDWLENIQTTINAFEDQNSNSDTEGKVNFENSLVKVMSDFFNQVLPAKNTELSKLLGNIDADSTKHAYEYFRTKLHALIYQAPIASRTYHKPLGYAGDYEMMNLLYSNENLGNSLFAKCLNSYWASQPAAQAVRNRAQYLIRRISQKISEVKSEGRRIRILSVASGPAMEWQKIVGELKELNHMDIEVDLLDQDEISLKHAQLRLRQLKSTHASNIKFNFINKAIKNIIVSGLDTKNYDLIYTAGLFDYFSDPVAIVAGQKLFESLRPGGEVIIGNFNVDNPSSIIMDLALDWALIYRSEADLHRMFSGLGGEIRNDKEYLNINLFCNIKKRK